MNTANKNIIYKSTQTVNWIRTPTKIQINQPKFVLKYPSIIYSSIKFKYQVIRLQSKSLHNKANSNENRHAIKSFRSQRKIPSTWKNKSQTNIINVTIIFNNAFKTENQNQHFRPWLKTIFYILYPYFPLLYHKRLYLIFHSFLIKLKF